MLNSTVLWDIHCRVCKGQGKHFFYKSQHTVTSSLSISLVYVCEIYQYSVDFISALILLGFVLFEGRELDITAK